MDKPDAKPPNIDYFYYFVVSFECRLSATMGHWNGQKNPREMRLGEFPG